MDHLGPERRAQLLRAKLTSLVRDAVARDGIVRDVDGITVRGALTGFVESGGPGFVMAELGTPAVVAGALSWAMAEGAVDLTVFVDLDAPVAARFAGYFDFATGSGAAGDGPPSTATVKAVTGALSVVVRPEPLPRAIPVPDVPAELLEVLRSHDLEVVSEHGVVRGEVLGLEVARLVIWPTETGGDGQLHLEVGVGRFDRDAVWAVNDGGDLGGALAEAVAMVRRYRHAGAAPHPLGRLSRERWLRSVLIDDPGLVGASSLEPVGMTIEAGGMKDPHPAGALGHTTSGEPLVVVTSVGVDLSTMPLAADLRAAVDPAAALLVAVPATDVVPAQERLASMLTPPARVVPLDVPWQS